MNQVIEKQASVKCICDHCGDPIIGKPIIEDDHQFCCQGCHTVYQLIYDYGLSDFYDIDSNAGLSQRFNTSKDFSYLDEEDVFSKLVKQVCDNVFTTTLYIPQIHCPSCIWILEKLSMIKKGILVSRVDFVNKSVEIKFNTTEISLKEIVTLITSLGYEPTIDLHANTINKNQHHHDLIIKIGVAGFAFGNIMLFSFPEYLGIEKSNLAQYFNVYNFFLASLSLFYAGREYLVQGWANIRYRYLDINLPLALGLVAMYGISIHYLWQGQGGYFDSLAGLVFFLLVSRWYQEVHYASIFFERDVKSYFPLSVDVVTNGQYAKKSLDHITIGDHISIKNNQVIPIDGILLSPSASIDYSFVSGEQRLITVLKGEKIYAGGKLKDSSIIVQANDKVDNAYLVKLWDHSVFKDRKMTDHTAVISKAFTIIILVLAVCTFIGWSLTSFSQATVSALSVLIIACPCAIAISKPFLYGNMLNKLSRQKMYVNNMISFVQASYIDHIVLDKTGTITSQEDQGIRYEGRSLGVEDIRRIHALLFQSYHPLSIALEQKLRSDVIYDIVDFEEFEGLGTRGYCKGQLVEIGSSKFINGTPSQEADTCVYVKIEGTLMGKYIFTNTFRPALSKIVQQFHEDQIKTSLLSGDNDRDGQHLNNMLGSKMEMHFRQDPYQKMEFIKSQKQQYKVCMIGDGLNDSGAFKESDLGIAITEDQNNFTPSCDVIMHSSSFDKIPAFFKMARATRYTLYGAYGIAVLYNVVGLSMAISGQLSPIFAAILMPISSITIVLYSSFMSWLIVKRYL